MKDRIRFDQFGIYPHATEREIFQSAGLLPIWIIDAPDDEAILDTFKREYQFGVHEMKGGKVSEDGIYTYPEDEPLYPILEIEKNKERFYQYLYAICAIVQEDGSTFITRLD